MSGPPRALLQVALLAVVGLSSCRELGGNETLGRGHDSLDGRKETSDFEADCLRKHNELRRMHGSPPLEIDPEVRISALNPCP